MLTVIGFQQQEGFCARDSTDAAYNLWEIVELEDRTKPHGLIRQETADTTIDFSMGWQGLV